jgi:hypothetical protein
LKGRIGCADGGADLVVELEDEFVEDAAVVAVVDAPDPDRTESQARLMAIFGIRVREDKAKPVAGLVRL